VKEVPMFIDEERVLIPMLLHKIATFNSHLAHKSFLVFTHIFDILVVLTTIDAIRSPVAEALTTSSMLTRSLRPRLWSAEGWMFSQFTFGEMLVYYHGIGMRNVRYGVFVLVKNLSIIADLIINQFMI
jgi:hypothetical protein